MFLFVFGLAGGFAQWCDAVAGELAQRAFGPTELIRADTLEQLALRVMETGTSRAVVSSRRPGGGLRAALVENGRNFVVALDDPGSALIDLVLGEGLDLAAAVQAVASSCAALIDYRCGPGTLVLHRDRDRPQVAATVAAIARHFAIAIDDSQIADLVAELAAGDAARQPHDAVAWWNGLAASEQAMATGALGSLIEHQPEGQSPSFTWTHELFFHGDRPDQRVAGPVDITGRAHCLMSGPYILLPGGAWTLTMAMLFSRAAAEHDFLVEVCADRTLASGTIQPQQQDRAELTIDFVLGGATEEPVAIRVSSLRAAFDGAITVVGATCTRAPPAPAADAPGETPGDTPGDAVLLADI